MMIEKGVNTNIMKNNNHEFEIQDSISMKLKKFKEVINKYIIAILE
jgi:hypothetical protein